MNSKKKLIIGVFIVLLCIAGIATALAFIEKDTAASVNEINQISRQEDQSQGDEPSQEADLAAEGRRIPPDFNLNNLNGENISLSEFRGEKPVVLDFWATWCHNCKRDMPQLQKLYEEYNQEFEVVAINLKEDKKTVQGFIEENDINFPIALDTSGDVGLEYGILYTNTHVLINTDGSASDIVVGDIQKKHIDALLEGKTFLE